MSTWMYQLSETKWSASTFRKSVHEGKPLHWRYRRKRGKGTPSKGDSIVLFYCRHRSKKPGFYGWATVKACDASENSIKLTPKAPTNRLKMKPWWGGQAKALADEMRGGMPRPTLHPVSKSAAKAFRVGIRKWLRSMPEKKERRATTPRSDSCRAQTPRPAPPRRRAYTRSQQRKRRLCVTA